jgi:tetrahydromethanopterin S-methyltransferase subunit C
VTIFLPLFVVVGIFLVLVLGIGFLLIEILFAFVGILIGMILGLIPGLLLKKFIKLKELDLLSTSVKWVNFVKALLLLGFGVFYYFIFDN